MRSPARRRAAYCAFALAAACAGAAAGPPYVSDDPEPTELGKHEVYLFASGETARGGSDGQAGIDWNYGAGEDLQLTAVLPLDYAIPARAPRAAGGGNIELAAKIRLLHRDAIGWDVAVFPRVFLPHLSARVGDAHAALLLPVWAQREWDPDWTTFGGGGCVIHPGRDARNYCLAGWALTHKFTPRLELGAELVHQGADTRDAHASTRLGFGARYDLDDTYHVLIAAGPGLERPAETGRYAWYAALLLTY